MILIDGDSPRVRETDPLTSHEAADSNNIFSSREVVLITLAALGPLADHELIEDHQFEAIASNTKAYTEQRIRTARSELVDEGLVEFSGEYRTTRRDRRTRVWQLADNDPKPTGDPSIGGGGIVIPIDASCPHCGWPERTYDTHDRRFGCIKCTYRSDEKAA